MTSSVVLRSRLGIGAGRIRLPFKLLKSCYEALAFTCGAAGSGKVQITIATIID